MEAAEALKQAPRPDLGFNDDPSWFLRAANYLDPESPVDSLLIDYKEDIASENLPTAAEQRVLITGLKNGNLESARALVEGHQGLIAAVAYPFKAGGISEDDLLHAGRHAFIQAAKNYDREGLADFSDHTAAAIHDSLSVMFPNLAGDSFIELPGQPMEGVYQFMETVRPTKAAQKIATMDERAKSREKSKLTADELQVLCHLHLKAGDISSATGIEKVERVDELLASLKKKLGAETREEAALIAMEHGVEYDVVNIPGREHFTVEERLLAMRLGMRNKSIVENLGFSISKVKELGASLRKKTGARTRAEILLLAHIHDFEPTEEEMNPPTPPILERMSPLQHKIMQRVLYMRDKDIAAQPDIDLSESGVGSLVSNLIAKAELPHISRTALILELHRHGMEFDGMASPDAPLSESLYTHEIEIAKLLHMPYEDIIEELGLDCTVERLGEIVYQARNKIGARTRQELALMVEVFYDEAETTERSFDNNEWRLAKHLGLKALAACDIEELLIVTTDKQKAAITTYYLGNKAVTWHQASEELGLHISNVQSSAQRGIRSMVRELENGTPAREQAGV